MKIIDGDLLKLAEQGLFDVVVHGCNCHHAMGGGIARQISAVWPEALEADKTTPFGDPGKLGSISQVEIQRNGNSFTVVNGYTQFHPGADLRYDALREVFQNIKREFPGKKIGFPKIGAGIAGGNWERIKGIIEEELEGEECWVVVFRK
ncbi:MAG TPA: macro domain-containing protein [Caldisericia bacterium]|mgnify:CR=1 FL=1|nr:macro domain-containing protein [Caldisericia bacterium]HPF48669.1 macro domain-containing protein [Caldisericia bacterium]HPI83671.1 macro domain-containing protein [Caldisericia bacterium]HPQ93124.1 macro domain-containing protein [Caldisericia bacterium]HRV75043.1 macro domain-containing protein [Caldisericia bacterium]